MHNPEASSISPPYGIIRGINTVALGVWKSIKALTKDQQSGRAGYVKDNSHVVDIVQR